MVLFLLHLDQLGIFLQAVCDSNDFLLTYRICNRRMDPRQIKSYQDLDAPVGGDIELQYD